MERLHKQVPKQRPAPPEEVDPAPTIEPNLVSKAAAEFLLKVADV